LIRLALRFDDPSPTSHRGVEEGVLRTLQRSGARATVAVIPFRDGAQGRLALDREQTAHLLAAQARGHVEIALHGHSHRCRGPAHPRPSEFVGVDAREQATLIAEGARHLRGLFGHEAISGFVPPWNSYDDATLAAVQSDVQFVTLRDIAERGRMRAQSRLLSHARLKPRLPWKLRQRLPEQYMVDAPLWRQLLG